MKYEIRSKPAFAAVVLTLQPDDRIVAQAGAMVSMASLLSVRTRFSGGWFEALLKKCFGGESLFVSEFENRTRKPLELVLSQRSIGDIVAVELKHSEICLQPGAYIAHTTGVQMGVSWAGWASGLAGTGLFKLKLSGQGLVFLGGYGGITQQRISGEYRVDTGHLLAYEPCIKTNIQMAGGLVNSVTSGEGLVNCLSGQGRVYLQSRSVDGLVRFVRSKL